MQELPERTQTFEGTANTPFTLFVDGATVIESAERPTTDSDSPWKEALEGYFPAFMALLFPEVHLGIDWSRGYEFLDKELQKVVRDAELGRRLVDKLVKVWRPGGEEAWLLIHIEVQGQVDPEFNERMFVYHYRLYDRYHRPVVSLAVLGDEQSNWRPGGFGYGLWGCEIRLRFPMVKLVDYLPRWEELEASGNPFSVVLMAHLKAQQTRQHPEDRLRWKLRLAKSLYRQQFGREDILELFRFIDWLMMLPDELEERFDEDLLAYEQERHMPYVTSVERRGIQKGHHQGLEQGLELGLEQGLEQGEQGIPQGEALILKRQLRRRFGDLPQAIEKRLDAASTDELEHWADQILDAKTLSDVFQE